MTWFEFFISVGLVICFQKVIQIVAPKLMVWFDIAALFLLFYCIGVGIGWVLIWVFNIPL